MNRPSTRWIGKWWHRLARGNRLLLLFVLVFSVAWVTRLMVREEQLLASLAQTPTDSDALNRLIDFYWWNGMPTRGFTHLNRLADAHPNAPALRWWAGFMMLSKALDTGASVEEALSVLEQVAPTYPEAYFDIGTARWYEGDYERAAAAFERGLTATDTLTDTTVSTYRVVYARWRLADAYKALGKKELASELFARLATGEEREILTWAEPYERAARGEIHPAQWRALTVTLTSDNVTADYREGLTAAVVRDVLGSAPEYDALGALIGAARVNNVRLALVSPESAELVRMGDSVQARVQYEMPNGQYWWLLRYPQSGSDLAADIYLPLGAASSPLTLTVTSDGVKLVSFAPPPDEMGRDYARWLWLPDSNPPPTPIVATVEAEYDPLTLAQLDVWTSRWSSLPYAMNDVVFALATLAAGAIYIARLTAGEWARSRWLSLTLDTVGGLALAFLFTVYVAEPIYFATQGGELLYTFGWTADYKQVCYVALALLVAIIPWVTHQPDKTQSRFLRHLGALFFIGYLAVRFTTWNWLWWHWLVAVPLGVVIYYLWLVPNRPAQRAMCGIQPAEIIARRAELLQALAEHLQACRSASLLSDWPRRIAEGKVKADDYETVSAKIDVLVEQTQRKLDNLAKALHLEETPVRDVALATGPHAHPWRNALAAILYGFIPYLFFLILAQSAPGQEWWRRIPSSLTPLELLSLLRDFIGMAWGPLYLLFFGSYYWWLRGRNGLEKGLRFSLALVAVLVLPNFVSVRSVAAVGSQVWEAVRIFVTFAFCGLAMDLNITRWRWRQLLQLYDSPTLTALGTVLVGALTTVITGIITGTLSQIVGLAVRLAAEPIGASLTGLGP